MRLALNTTIVHTQLMPNSSQTIWLKPQSAIAMQIVISLLSVGFIVVGNFAYSEIRLFRT